MTRFTAAALSLGLSLPLLAGSSVHGDPQKYRMHEQDVTGDEVVNSSSTDMFMNFTVKVEGREVMLQTSSREREQFTESILGARPGATTSRRVYAVSRTAETGIEGKTVTKVSSLQGKTMTLRVADGKASITAISGALAPDDRKALLDGLVKRIPFFPDREIGPGDEWSPDPALLAASFKGANNPRMKARFEEVVDCGGHPCARIHVEMTIEGKPEGSPLALSLKTSGNAYYALDIQRLLVTEATGPITAKGEVPGPDGKPLMMEATGTWTLKQSSRWLKIEGKPAPNIVIPPMPATPAPAAPAPAPEK